jgi:hypothetical protein
VLDGDFLDVFQIVGGLGISIGVRIGLLPPLKYMDFIFYLESSPKKLLECNFEV